MRFRPHPGWILRNFVEDRCARYIRTIQSKYWGEMSLKADAHAIYALHRVLLSLLGREWIFFYLLTVPFSSQICKTKTSASCFLTCQGKHMPESHLNTLPKGAEKFARTVPWCGFTCFTMAAPDIMCAAIQSETRCEVSRLKDQRNHSVPC